MDGTPSPFRLINIDLFLPFSLTPVHLSPAQQHTHSEALKLNRESHSCFFMSYLLFFLPNCGILQLRHQHPAAPGHKVSLCGHLAAWGIAVHLPHTLDLPAATEAHVGRGVHLCG